ncbi:helix-turn-helix transcriptional regulator [Flavobacterium sp.]|jgi:transcriptional regulator with XRE-family HTH domain|uniref:helix-turn-helix transcriptional regulator n=1 Tax=Flavobacterium sp. TaxID=239 RepID=UPI002A80EFA4|nr:helix-turn-helix transcriptional regulator [Flavobacterium sp.]
MVNTEDFIKRLEEILEYYGLSASGFADKISVQRSSLSHLLSGRNKPSLDFILKIIDEFPEVDLYWILNGKGTFPKSENKIIENNSSTPISKIENVVEKKIESNSDLFSQNVESENTAVKNNLEEKFSNTQNFPQTKNSSNIERIVVFYKNGSFKEYQPE